MQSNGSSGVVIVDYGMGNLYSVLRGCEHTGLPATISADPAEVAEADGIILPGVGAFEDAMRALDNTGLADALRAAADRQRPLLGICLGLQLLMSGSDEFGFHGGLEIVPGTVERLGGLIHGERKLKVPQVGWNMIERSADVAWEGTLLSGLTSGDSMYFVHSYCVRPADPTHVLSSTRYGDDRFCSTLQAGSVMGCQFHPELSGHRGLSIYRNFAALLGSVATA